jgi:hypothetical protein
MNPEFKSSDISGLDGRSAERRFMKRSRAALIAHVGGRPSPTQSALIDQAVNLALRIRLMDLQFLRDGEMSEHASRTYLAWSNSYTRTLRQLGLKGASSAPPKLSEYMAGYGA